MRAGVMLAVEGLLGGGKVGSDGFPCCPSPYGH